MKRRSRKWLSFSLPIGGIVGKGAARNEGELVALNEIAAEIEKGISPKTS